MTKKFDQRTIFENWNIDHLFQTLYSNSQN